MTYCGVCHSDLHQFRNEWLRGDVKYGYVIDLASLE